MALGNFSIASHIRNSSSNTANMQNDRTHNEYGCDCRQPNSQGERTPPK
jgi:hypothetical protein